MKWNMKKHWDIVGNITDYTLKNEQFLARVIENKIEHLKYTTLQMRKELSPDI